MRIFKLIGFHSQYLILKINKSQFSLIYVSIICKDIILIMTKDKIKHIRNKINNLDDKILELLDKRSELVSGIGKFKDTSKGVVDVKREKSVLNRLLNNSKGMEPLSRLPSKFRYDRLVKLLISIGIEPVSSLKAKFK